MTTPIERNRLFAARVRQSEPLLLPGVANPLTALIAEDIGYEALYLTGAGLSNMNLGLPDIGILTLNDIVDAVSAVRAVVDLPLVVDAETGFGNAVHVYHTVRRLEAAGASAIQIEDQVAPKKCGHFDGKSVVPLAEMVDKVRAAVDARTDANVQIIARTDACAVEGFDAAMARAMAYIEAGADIMFVEALPSLAEIRQVPGRLACPQLINIVFGGKTPEIPLSEVREMGYSLALYANAALQASIKAMQRVLGELHRSGSLAAVSDDLVSFAERQRLVRKDRFDALERHYSTPASHAS